MRGARRPPPGRTGREGGAGRREGSQRAGSVWQGHRRGGLRLRDGRGPGDTLHEVHLATAPARLCVASCGLPCVRRVRPVAGDLSRQSTCRTPAAPSQAAPPAPAEGPRVLQSPAWPGDRQEPGARASLWCVCRARFGPRGAGPGRHGVCPPGASRSCVHTRSVSSVPGTQTGPAKDSSLKRRPLA